MKKLFIALTILAVVVTASCTVGASTITPDMVMEALSYYPGASSGSGGMIVFWQTETGQLIKSYSMDCYILDNGDTWDVYRSDGNALTHGLNKSTTSYGYFKYQEIIIEEDENFNPIPIYIDDLDLQPLTGDDLPHSQHIGRLDGVNPTLARPATVTRKWHGMTFQIQCLVSQAVVDMWAADTLNIGDYVIVSFIDEIPDTEEMNLAIVVDKVYDSWS